MTGGWERGGKGGEGMAGKGREGKGKGSGMQGLQAGGSQGPRTGKKTGLLIMGVVFNFSSDFGPY